MRWALRAFLFFLPLSAFAAEKALTGPMAGARQAFADALQQASVHPSPAHLVLVLLLMTVIPATLVVPMSLLTFLVATAFKPLLSAPLIMTGMLLNTAFAWTLARTVFGARLENWLERRGGALAAIRAGARKEPLKWAILARYVPAPFMSQPMVLASTGVGLGTTLLGTFIGMIPWTAAYVWAGSAGRQGSLGAIGKAIAAVVLVYVLAAWLRKRALAAVPALPAPLTSRDPALPQLTLYTVAGHGPSDEARRELQGLRERLGFEVEETVLGPGADPALNAAYEDHAPVAFFDGQKLFNFQIDENVLALRLQDWRRRQGQA